jgi:hypothetical protein
VVEGVEEIGLVTQREPFADLKILTDGKIVSLQTGRFNISGRGIAESVIWSSSFLFRSNWWQTSGAIKNWNGPSLQYPGKCLQ